MSYQMHKGDALTLLRGMDSSSVSHVITDPPYDAKTHANVMSMKGGSAGDVQLGFEALSTMAHVKEMLRVARGWVLAFCSLEMLGEYKLFAGDAWVRAGFWDRINGTPQLTGDRPGQPGEGVAIMWAGGGRMSWNGGGMPALWRIPRASGDRFHPTEKPEALMMAMVRQFTNYGDTILDPFAGSGTTGVAAVRLGRNFIGCEMLAEHHETAIMRLSATHEQMDLQYKPKKKSKQLKLTEAANEKEGEKEGSASELPDHRPSAEGDARQVAGDGEESRQANDGDRQGLDRSGDGEQAEEESAPFDGQEDDGQGLGEAQAIGDTEEFGGEDFPSEADPERNAGW